MSLTSLKSKSAGACAACAAALLLSAALLGLPQVAEAGQPIDPYPGVLDDVRYHEVAGADRYETAAQAVELAFKDKSEAPGGVVVATGEDFPDALAASGLAGLLGYPVLLTPVGSLHPAVPEAIESLGGGEVVVVGGEAAISPAVVDALASLPTVTAVNRVGGADRYGTADAVYELGEAAGGWESGTAVVVTGEDFPDALSISSYAAWAGAPVFLVDADGNLGESARGRVADYGRVLVIGGEAVVPACTEADLAALNPGAEVVRLGGDDRYGTCSEVVAFASDYQLLGVDPLDLPYDLNKWSYYVATGSAFPDALASGVAFSVGDLLPARLYLADDSPDGMGLLDKMAGRSASISDVYLLGGTDALSPSLRQAIADGVGGNPVFE